jgi:hypothetical protein
MTTLCDRIRAGIAQSRLAHGMEPTIPMGEELVDEELVDEENLAARVEDLRTMI